jgi:hypothetical protein
MAFISNGVTILDNGSFEASLGSMVLISEQTASSSANISFTSGIDSTYPIYKFEFINCHPSNDNVDLVFNISTDGGSNYNVTKTTSYFFAQHNEADTITNLTYATGDDLAQSTAFQVIASNQGSDNDQSCAGSLTLFNPSSTTFVKHFMSQIHFYARSDLSHQVFVGGYGNTTSSVNAIRFQMTSGNIDSGTIKLYGIKDS